MDEWVMRFRVGVVVVAAAIITVILIMVFGAWPNVLQPQYTIHVNFPEAPGITVDTPVRKSGVLIGRVSEVKLLDQGGVVVSARIDRQYKLRRNEMCRIGAGSLLGDAVLEFVPMGRDEKLVRFDGNQDGQLDSAELRLSEEVTGDGDFLTEGIVASNPLRVFVNLEGNMVSALESIEGAGSEVSLLARNLNQSMGTNEGRLERILTKAESSLDRFESTMTSLQSVLGDEELAQKLKSMLDDLPAAVADARKTFANANDTLTSFQRVADRAEKNLENLEGVTEPLGESGPQIVANVQRSSENLDEILTQLAAFTAAMNSGEGTLAKLVHDDELYTRIDAVMANVEEVSKKLLPIVNDVRILTDKLARDPSQLGVKGALDRRPGGIKTTVDW